MRRRLLVLALLSAAAGGPARADDAAPAPTAPVDVPALLARLDAPFLADRQGAVETLIARGAAARPAVIAAFRDPAARRRAELAQVLAADGSPEALDALLDVLPTAHDVATERSVQRSLIAHAERVTDAVLAYRDDHGQVPPSVATLAGLLVRARIEARFLSRKSASGSTGSYPGQFEVLRPDRRRAVEICRDILRDRPPKVPGVFPVGTYAFLRPPPFLAEPLELRSMAVHALAELTVEEDGDVLDDLEDTYVELFLRGRLHQRQGMRRDEESRLGDGVLAVLVRRRPAGPVRREVLELGLRPRFAPTWKEHALALIDAMRSDSDTDEDAAQLALQIARFDLAVDIYRRLLRISSGGIAHYNLACAYARWSREPRPNDDPKALRERAMDEMEAAHEAGYLDWVWMSEDRDLDPIRELPRFAALVERMKQSFVMPAGRPGGGR